MLGAIVLAVALSTAACSDHGSMPNMDHSGGTATSSSSAGVFNDADVAFAQHMIPHHQQAVEMAELGAGRASDQQVKSLVAQIKAAQGPEIATMTGWLTAWGKPATMGGMDHSGMPGMMTDADMTALKGLSGSAFDKRFCTMMIAHHEGAIAMANEELAKGANPEAKKLAQQIITGQQAEIDTMKTIAGRI